MASLQSTTLGTVKDIQGYIKRSTDSAFRWNDLTAGQGSYYDTWAAYSDSNYGGFAWCIYGGALFTRGLIKPNGTTSTFLGSIDSKEAGYVTLLNSNVFLTRPAKTANNDAGAYFMVNPNAGGLLNCRCYGYTTTTAWISITACFYLGYKNGSV